MREVMASSAGSADPSRMCKKVTVVIWALAHLMVTVYVLRVLFDGSSSQGFTTVSDFLTGLNPYRSQKGDLIKLQLANRKAAIEFRRRSAPLLLMLRVKDIEAEVAMKTQGQVPVIALEKPEEEDLKEQVVLDTGQRGVPAVVDDTVGAIQRSLLPPEKCQPEPYTDFGGVAVRWGLTFHVNNAAECCRACSKQASYARGSQRKCNVWVFCPQKDGCPSPDGYEHKFGECWLKQADKPHAVVHDYSLVMRDKSSRPRERTMANEVPVLALVQLRAVCRSSWIGPSCSISLQSLSPGKNLDSKQEIGEARGGARRRNFDNNLVLILAEALIWLAFGHLIHYKRKVPRCPTCRFWLTSFSGPQELKGD